MKEVIKTCLDRYNDTIHTNVELSNLIIGAIKTQGWYLDLGDTNKICEHNNDINSICSECDEQQARESWVCEYCNKSTYDVEWDYIGSGTNHLGCELKEEMKEKFIEESNKNPVPKQHERIRREKNWLQKKLEDKVFDKDADYIYESPDGGETIYKRKFNEDKRELYKVKTDDT